MHSVASEVQNSISGVTASTGSGVTSEASLSASLTIFFVVMGLVALLAAAFGVTNTMIMSVSERTREIGTLRAIGAQRRQVMKIFMSESFLIGAVGAVVGAFLGIVISLILPYFSSSVSSSRPLWRNSKRQIVNFSSPKQHCVVHGSWNCGKRSGRNLPLASRFQNETRGGSSLRLTN